MVAENVPPEKYSETLEVLWDMRMLSVKLAQTYSQLPADYDTSLNTWLEKTTYTNVEKQGFRNEVEIKGYLEKQDRACKCFIKAETYPEYKHARPIKSRTDRFKAFMGPLFQGINEMLFAKTDTFIKKIPVNERPARLKELFQNFPKLICTDYSSFEAHFVNMIMFAIEFPFYIWVTWNLPVAQTFRDELYTIMSQNVCKFFDFIVECSSRASGEMNTSSGNGYVNDFLFEYVTTIKQAEVKRKQFEGDDGITATIPHSASPTSEDYKTLGWVCKMITVDKFEEASFCGIVSDIDDLVNVCDIKAYIADFGWTRQQYLNANNTTLLSLIRAKGYSAIYQYPACPILDALGHYALRITDTEYVHNKMKRMFRKGRLADSRYKNIKYELMFKTLGRRPSRRQSPQNTRILVEKLFNIEISQQIAIEEWLDQLTTIQHLDIDIEVPEAWTYNTEMFVTHEYIHEVASHLTQLNRDLNKIL